MRNKITLFICFLITSLFFINCKNNSAKEKELELKERELELKEKKNGIPPEQSNEGKTQSTIISNQESFEIYKGFKLPSTKDEFSEHADFLWKKSFESNVLPNGNIVLLFPDTHGSEEMKINISPQYENDQIKGYRFYFIGKLSEPKTENLPENYTMDDIFAAFENPVNTSINDNLASTLMKEMTDKYGTAEHYVKYENIYSRVVGSNIKLTKEVYSWTKGKLSVKLLKNYLPDGYMQIKLDYSLNT